MSLIMWNIEIVAVIFHMLHFMIMSLHQPAAACTVFLFYFIASRPYNCNKIFHAS